MKPNWNSIDYLDSYKFRFQDRSNFSSSNSRNILSKHPAVQCHIIYKLRRAYVVLYSYASRGWKAYLGFLLS